MKKGSRINILSNGQVAKLELPHEWLPVAFGAIALGMGLYSAARVGISERAKQAELRSLTETNDRLTAEVQAFSDRSRALSAKSEQADSLQKLVARKNYWSDAFKELSSIVPEGVWLTNFSHQPENPARRLFLAGQATSQAKVAELFAKLERSHHFKGAVMISSVRDEGFEPAKYAFEFAVPAAGTPVTPAAKWVESPTGATTTTTTTTTATGATAGAATKTANPPPPAVPVQSAPTLSAEAKVH